LFIYNEENKATGKHVQYLHYLANFEIQENDFFLQLADCLVPIYCPQVDFQRHSISYNEIPAYLCPKHKSENFNSLPFPMPSQAMFTFQITVRFIHIILTSMDDSTEMNKSHEFLESMDQFFCDSELPVRARYIIACLVSLMWKIGTTGVEGLLAGFMSASRNDFSQEAKTAFREWSNVIQENSG
jgi:hypothetical protein